LHFRSGPVRGRDKGTHKMLDTVDKRLGSLRNPGLTVEVGKSCNFEETER